MLIVRIISVLRKSENKLYEDRDEWPAGCGPGRSLMTPLHGCPSHPGDGFEGPLFNTA